MKKLLFILVSIISFSSLAQDYFLKDKGPFNADIPTPEQFLGYAIGSHHTRHDRIVAYLEELARKSEKASIIQYGMTHEFRPLVILQVSAANNLQNLESIQQAQLQRCDPTQNQLNADQPVVINLGYNVHGNEPSSAEAAMLTAYILVASQSEQIKNFLDQSIIFIDPSINPDGRDRHGQWANMFKGSPMVKDPMDAEHRERWPYGRTNHYWFDLNRDWLLAINPESRGKLNWYHQWYPNVVTDFHEMGTNSTYFFEPMKAIGSKDPIMPKENYTTLNDKFAEYFKADLDAIGSLYFTKEAFDGTYPGYGSSYPDLQGGLGLLFEQASARGHVQTSANGELTFTFAIRNQLTSSLATVRAAVENKDLLFRYQQDFFKSTAGKVKSGGISGYVFGDSYDANRLNAFIDKLLIHRIKVHEITSTITAGGVRYEPGKAFIVPTGQPQYRMVQTFFETYRQYTDSVFYDASAWSVANFYNLNYNSLVSLSKMGEELKEIPSIDLPEFSQSNYAYVIPIDDYNVYALLYALQDKKVRVKSAFKPFSLNTGGPVKSFNAGSLIIPASNQKMDSDKLYELVKGLSAKHNVSVFSSSTGFSDSGIDLGSRYVNTLEKPNALMWVEDGVSSYEAGEVWHLLDTRVNMPITKIPLRLFNNADLDKYNVMVMVSGSYNQLDSVKIEKLKNWVKKGNTLITSRTASAWAIKKKIVKEKLIKKEDDKKKAESKIDEKRLPYISAPENLGKERVGGAIFNVELDLTHPVAFGYREPIIPVYRNSTTWIKPTKNVYSNVAVYTKNPHVDGFITKKNLNDYLKQSASVIVSKAGKGRVILFADNPNFRGSWYGTNKLFLNSIFLGQHVSVPE